MPVPAEDGAAFGAAAGLGKTRARLLAIKADTVERRRKAGGKLLAPGHTRKLAAHYYAVPDRIGRGIAASAPRTWGCPSTSFADAVSRIRKCAA